MIFGSAIHLAILEPDKFKEMIFSHSYKTPKFNAEGQIFLHRDTIAEIEIIASTVKKHPIASELLNNTRKEISLFWKDSDIDIMCKARIDAYNERHNLIIDLKYCKDASMKGFSRQAAQLKYHWQPYWYLTGAELLFQRPGMQFIFICIEGEPTYSVALYLVTPQVLLKAEESILEQKNIYANCLWEDTWPGYPEEIQELHLPSWA
jgi:hypothetical protein